MHTPRHSSPDAPIVDRQTLQSLGVLVPIRLNPLKVSPGRHPLGRAGDGMRLLRTRPYIAGEDNPRDIDKFSPPNAPHVVEWEDEAQASIVLFADISASMAWPQKAALRNASLLQLTYSMWRAGDRVSTVLFDSAPREHIRAANLKTQMNGLSVALQRTQPTPATNIASVVTNHANQASRQRSSLAFVVSDFVENHDYDLATTWRPIINSLQRNVIPVIVTFSISDSMRGLSKLRDAENSKRRLTWLSPQRIYTTNKQEHRRVATLIRFFRSSGLDCMVIKTQHEIYPQLATLARTRRQRKF